MTAEVHSILEAKPHMSGIAKCLACAHEWSAVAECGETCLSCPECGTWRGVMKGNPIPDPHFECGCGCVHFTIMKDQFAMCCHCSLLHDFSE